MQIRKMCSRTSTWKAVGLVACAGFFIGAMFDNIDIFGDIRQASAITIIGVIVRRCIVPAVKPGAEMFAAGFEQGMNQGWTKGHREARPVVIPINALEQLAPLHSGTCRDVHIVGSS